MITYRGRAWAYNGGVWAKETIANSGDVPHLWLDTTISRSVKQESAFKLMAKSFSKRSWFSSENQTLQGGQFDHAHRLFNSVRDTWSSAAGRGNISDVKELIPEFFYIMKADCPRLQQLIDYLLVLGKTLEKRKTYSEINGLARYFKKILLELNEYDYARHINKTFNLKEAL
nr:protein SPIRRIG [Tanacetum cinerariifolium]